MCLMLHLHTSKPISMPNAWDPSFQGRSPAVSTEKVPRAGGQSNQTELHPPSADLRYPRYVCVLQTSEIWPGLTC